ncbi:MAG: SDR family oxidoreductase [Chloroflexi bacterium]|nr:SDR family oxidoreductase [Chloroflexota bacterium]
MRALVAGGAGFVGSHLCDALLALGHTVTVLDNYITGDPRNLAHLEASPEFRCLRHDITEPLPEAPCDAVFHLASPASPEGYGRYPLETLLTNSVGTHRLLELAARHRARFLLASTSEVYGDPLVHPQPEDYWGNVNPVGPRSCYDEGKRFAEALTVNFAAQRGVDVRIVRIFNTYGPRNQPEDGRVIPNFLTQALAGAPITVYGDGQQSRSFCYVSDLVDGLLRAMDAPGTAGQVLNLGNPQEYPILEVARLAKALTNSPSPIVHLPGRPEEITRRRPDISKARRLLGWQPTMGLEEGLRKTIPWFEARRAQRPSVPSSASP